MNIFRLILQEIRHRKLNFLLSLLSVIVAISCLAGADTLLQTEQILTQKAGEHLVDEARKITKGLGFNIYILPKDQDRNEINTEGTFSKTMPEEFVKKLADTKLMTINHLLPIIVKKTEWKPGGQKVIVVGTRGEIPILERALKKPLQDSVPEGTMVVGSLVAEQQQLKVNDKVELKGQSFSVSKIKKQTGTAEDSTVYINLKEAQQMFEMQNLIHAIQALECNCATVERLAEIDTELQAILPGTQVIEEGSKATARAKTRVQAAQTAKDSLAQFEKFSSLLVPIVLAGCGTWIAFLAFSNVRQRESEIGVLRAIGLRSHQILMLFLGKALVIGLVGALVGYLSGFAVGLSFSSLPEGISPVQTLFSSSMLLISLATAFILVCLGSWIPAMIAARQDPAVILQHD